MAPFLAVLLDAYSRRVVGWAMHERMTEALVLSALQMALTHRHQPPGLLHHTDQGRQYTGTAYQQQVAQAGMVGSMSRKGNCYDNAVVESFFSSLKNEVTHHRRYQTREEARGRRSFTTSSCFTIGDGSIRPWATSAPWPRRPVVTLNPVSTKPGAPQIARIKGTFG
jgi:hypothetical protein